jgi:hypothetical protein
MNNGCSPTIIAGQLVLQEPCFNELPTLAVRVLSKDRQAVLAETITTPAGEFSLEIPVSGAGQGRALLLPLIVHLADGGEKVLVEASLTISPGEAHTLDIEVSPSMLAEATPLTTDSTEPALLVTDSIRRMREIVETLIKDGILSAEAREMLENGIRPLEWTQGLLDDARRVLGGDMDASERLRSALLGLGVGPELPEWYEANNQLDDLLQTVDSELPDAFQVIHRKAMLSLVLAAVWATEDREEAQEMLNALATVLWSYPWLELLVRAVQSGNIGALKPLMAAPRPGWELPGGWKPGGGRTPGLPPGWGNVPRPKEKGRPPIVGGAPGSKVPGLNAPINQRPTGQELCLFSVMISVAQAQREAPQYEIRSLSNPSACPGELLILSGVNFGTAGGTVLFHTDSQKAKIIIRLRGTTTDGQLWSDSEIRVRVPQGAAPGQIQLKIFVKTLHLCGNVYPIYRLGRMVPYFEGGIPAIFDFTVNYEKPAVVAEPGSDLTIHAWTSVGTGVLATLTIFNPDSSIFFTTTLPGGQRWLTVLAPTVTSPTNLRVVLRVQNRWCGASEEKTIAVRVQRRPALRIAGVEVIQAIQRFSLTGEKNSVRFCARCRTVARVYVDSGLIDGFDYGAGANTLPGVTGSITLRRGGLPPATVTPFNTGGVVIARPAGLINRNNLPDTLNFLLPIEVLDGAVTIDVRVSVANPSVGAGVGWADTDSSTTVTFETRPRRGIVKFLVRDDLLGLPAPSDADFAASLQAARARYPIAEDGFVVHMVVGQKLMAIKHDLRTKDGWTDLLDDIEDFADDHPDESLIWAALVPSNLKSPINPNGYELKGRARQGNDVEFIIVWDDVRPCLAVQNGLGASFAHELGHVFGFDHSPCSDGDWPEDVDSSMPGRTEDVGMNTFTAPAPMIVGAGVGELMSYCDDQTRWPSIKFWHRMFTV